MRQFSGRLAVAAASVLLLSLALTGCSTPSGPGSVLVTFTADQTAKAQTVEVTVTDEVGNVVGQATLKSGETRTLSNIPLGPVTIDAVDLCTVATTLTAADPTATARFSPTNCEI